jgi:hypothetical protein
MEDNPRTILSPVLSRPQVKRQFELLDKAIDAGKARVDYTMAHDENILKAIEIVERFLRKKRRVCYGGQAINALLPKERRFYDARYTIPDYDFFTPSLAQDTKELIAELDKEGFANVSRKLSVHDGTSKILVNFVPVADCTELHPTLFHILQRRATTVNGILYADNQFLQMMMYLELSRPRGQVDRWKKVYERLTLLQHIFPSDGCDSPLVVSNDLAIDDRKAILQHCVKRKSVMLGPEFIELMEMNKGFTHMDTLAKRGGPVIFLSDTPLIDGEDIRDILTNIHKGRGATVLHEEFTLSAELFNFVTVRFKGKPVALIFQEDACHSYSVLQLDGEDEMRVGTHDLFLQVYYSILIFGKKELPYFKTPIDCIVRKLHAVEKKARNSPTKFVPAFGLRCSGHQHGIASLMREKAERTEREKMGSSKKSVTRSKKHPATGAKNHTRKQ